MPNDTTRTRKAPARKAAPVAAVAPVKRRRTAVARPVTPDLEVGKVETEPVAAKRDTIEFLGRTMPVKMVAAEQLVVWRRIARRLQGGEAAAAMDETPRDGETVEDARSRVATYGLDQFDRILTIVSSVLTDPADVGWVEDQMLAGSLRLAAEDGKPAVADIISLTMDHFTRSRQQQGDVAPRTGPQPRARRRA